MKNWYFIAYHNAGGSYCEWEIVHREGRFVEDAMNERIKFSGNIVGGVAHKLSTLTGKPIFSTISAKAGLPF